jgi:hypothetical protein
MARDAGCLFAGTVGSWECWGCPNIHCPHMEIPFSNLENSMVVADKAARKIKQRRVANYREIVARMGTDRLQEKLFREGLALVPRLRLLQARDAYELGLATLEEAAAYAGVWRSNLYATHHEGDAATREGQAGGQPVQGHRPPPGEGRG